MASYPLGPGAWKVAKSGATGARMKMLDGEGGAAAGVFLALIHAVVGRR